MSGNLLKRLERLEQKLAEMAARESAANCNCSDFTLAQGPELFEAEMNQTCPVHGLRRLGQIMVISIDNESEETIQKSLALSKLIEEYKRRLARYCQQIREEDEPEEF